MKKIILATLTLLTVASFANAEIGLGVKLGATAKKTNLDTLQNAFERAGWNTTLEESNFVFGFEGFYEGAISPTSAWGLRLGYEGIADDTLEISRGASRGKLDAIGSIVPLTAYYKYKTSDKFSIWGGAGIGFLFVDMKDAYTGSDKKNKVFPHIDAGVEWRLSQLVGLGLDLRYNIGAKIDNFDLDVVQYDIGGITGGLVLRFYFK